MRTVLAHTTSVASSCVCHPSSRVAVTNGSVSGSKQAISCRPRVSTMPPCGGNTALPGITCSGSSSGSGSSSSSGSSSVPVPVPVPVPVLSARICRPIVSRPKRLATVRSARPSRSQARRGGKAAVGSTAAASVTSHCASITRRRIACPTWCVSSSITSSAVPGATPSGSTGGRSYRATSVVRSPPSSSST